MSKTKSWYLEHKIDEKWARDERRWCPVESEINLSVFSDGSRETEGLSVDMNHLLSTLAEPHFPADASVEVDELTSKYVAHTIAELGQLPTFGWILISDILKVDWTDVVADNSAKSDAINSWLEHLALLGNPEHLRLIFMLHD
jgi:hypothetical protein